MSNTEKYNRDYYQANKERIRKARREKYSKDKEYRESAIKRARVQTVIKRAIKQSVPKQVKHDGEMEGMLTFSELAAHVNRNKDSLYRWRKKGFTPEPTHRDARGNGIYSMSQANYLGYLLKRCDNGSRHMTYEQMSIALKRVWKKKFTFHALNQAILYATKEGRWQHARQRQGGKERRSERKPRPKKARRS